MNNNTCTGCGTRKGRHDVPNLDEGVEWDLLCDHCLKQCVIGQPRPSTFLAPVFKDGSVAISQEVVTKAMKNFPTLAVVKSFDW